MALFDKTKNNTYERKIKILRDKTNFNLKGEKILNLYSSLGNEDLFFQVANIIVDNDQLSKKNEDRFLIVLKNFIDMHSYITESDTYLRVVKLLTQCPDILITDIIPKISYTFTNQEIIYKVLLYLFNLLKNNDNSINIDDFSNIEAAFSYLIAARKYYVDDQSLFATFISYIETLGVNKLKYADKEEIDKITKEFLDEDKKSNGIYDISQEELEYMSRKASELGITRSQLETLLKVSEDNIKNTKTVYNTLRDEAIESANMTYEDLQTKITNIINNFSSTFNELKGQVRRDMKDDGRLLIEAFEKELNQKKEELVNLISELSIECRDYQKSINNLKRDQSSVLSDINSYIENSQALKNLVDRTSHDNDFMKKLDLVKSVADYLEQNGGLTKVTQVGSSESNQSERIIVPPANKIIIQSQGEEDKPVDLTPIYYFDASTEYRKRFAKLMEKKKEMEARGEIFNECFDDVLAIVIHNNVPYIYGPSGTGKTYLVEKQLSKILELPVVSSHYVSYEQDILGYNNAGNGEYVPTNFYRSFRSGGIVLYDELDCSNPRPTTILNGFLKGQAQAPYTFPNGVSVPRHPNFRIIGAGNTTGEGRTVEYSARQKLDESQLQRVYAVECDYDERVEKNIFAGREGWLLFSKTFRDAINNIRLSNEVSLNSTGVFTTRDASEIVEYLNDGAFDYKKIIKYKFVQTKGVDYLRLIYGNMEKLYSGISSEQANKEYQELFNEFGRQIEAKAKKLSLGMPTRK